MAKYSQYPVISSMPIQGISRSSVRTYVSACFWGLVFYFFLFLQILFKEQWTLDNIAICIFIFNGTLLLTGAIIQYKVYLAIADFTLTSQQLSLDEFQSRVRNASRCRERGNAFAISGCLVYLFIIWLSSNILESLFYTMVR
jgi:hypothetical protein